MRDELALRVMQVHHVDMDVISRQSAALARADDVLAAGQELVGGGQCMHGDIAANHCTSKF